MKPPKNDGNSSKKATKNEKKTPKRRRKLPYIHTGDFSREEKLFAILDEGDQDTVVYIYRAAHQWPVGSFIEQCYPFPELLGYIRDEYGSGEYAIIIRRGTTMLFSGITHIEAPMNWQPRESCRN